MTSDNQHKLDELRKKRDRQRAVRPLISAARGDRPPLSHAQQRMWFLHQLEPDSGSYHMAFTRRLRGQLDALVLRRAFEDLVGRHEALRTVFPSRDGEPHQEVQPPARWELELEDHHGLDECALERLVFDEAGRVFDLAAGPLLRTRLVRVGEQEHVLFVTMHHIVSDGWSMDVFWRELAALYAAHARGESPTLPALPLQYVDYTVWQRSWLRDDELGRQLDYWKAQLRGAPEETLLPFKGARPPQQTFRGQQLDIELDPEVSTRLRALARREGATLFMTLLAAFRALLARYTGQDDLVIGTPIANRNRREIEGLIGLFVNTLVLRNQVRGDESFATLLAREKEVALAAYDHRDTPFEMIVDAIGVARSLNRTPVFQVLYAHAEAEPDVGFAGLAMEKVATGLTITPLDLSVTSWEAGDRLAASFLYNTDLFDGRLVEQLARHYRTLLERVSADPQCRIGEIDLLDADERRRIVVEANRTEQRFEPSSIPALFKAQAARTPDAIAVEFEGERVSYRELDERAQRIAGWLASRGVGRGGRVALSCRRSADLVAAIFGVLEAGAAYIPIDSTYPAERRAFIRSDSGATIDLDDMALRDALASTAPAPRITVDGQDVAYLLYTSGSTGLPKGVVVPHSAVVNLVASMRHTPGMTAADTLLSVTTLSFDMSVLEIYLPLTVGAKLVIASRDVATDGTLLAKTLEACGATIFQATPATWRMLLAGGWRPARQLRILCGGETLPSDLAESLASGCAELWNMYGPTETCVWSTCTRLELGQPITIGKPIANTGVFIVDAALQPVPIGVPGELCIAGHGVALGYLGRAALTAEKFVPHPFTQTAGARMYRTGDRARWLPDGTLQHLGRLDFQVKVRGHRIELGEIEAVLLGCGLVHDTVVVVRGDTPTDARLVAYVVPSEPELDISRLRSVLEAKLPPYMVPRAFVLLDALPLTPNLKVNREALPGPDFSTVAAEYVAPTNPVEEAIAKIWQEILGIPRAGIHDDFFTLGGHSLAAMRVVSRLREVLGVEVPVREVFAAPTLAAFACSTSARLGSSSSTIADTLREVLGEVRSGTQLTRATVAQEYFWYLSQADPDPVAYNIQVVFLLEGPLDREVLQRSVEAIVARHSIFRTAFREVDGKLFQYVSSDVPGFELEIRNAAPLPESDWPAEIDRTVIQYLPRIDLTSGHRICGRLTALAPDRHVLVLIVHHAVGDAASIGALGEEIFERYEELRSGTQPDDRRPVQFIDYAEARDRFARTPTGRARHDWWRSNLHGAQPLRLPVDFPRADHDARRAAAPLGITADLMHYPYFQRELPTAARDNVLRAARETRTTPFVVYLSGLAWLFHQLTGDDDICIENTYSERAEHRDLERVQGSVTQWTIMRIGTSGCERLRDVIARTAQVVGAAAEHGVISEYYELVPPSIRRAIFNYLPVGRLLDLQRDRESKRASDLRIVPKPRPFPLWKRPWELHLTMADLESSTQMFWTGIEKLFRRETVAALLDRYIDLLEHHLE